MTEIEQRSVTYKKVTPFVNPIELDVQKLNRGDLLQFVPNNKRWWWFSRYNSCRWGLYVGLRPYCGKEDVPCIVHSVPPKTTSYFFDFLRGPPKEHVIVMEPLENTILERKKNKVRVNNSFDEKYSPIGTDDYIVWRALCDISDKDVRHLQLTHEKNFLRNFEELLFVTPKYNFVWPLTSGEHVQKWRNGIIMFERSFHLPTLVFFSIGFSIFAFTCTDRYKLSPPCMDLLYALSFTSIKMVYFSLFVK